MHHKRQVGPFSPASRAADAIFIQLYLKAVVQSTCLPPHLVSRRSFDRSLPPWLSTCQLQFFFASACLIQFLNPLEHSVLLKGRYKKLDVKNAIQYSNEKCLISVTSGP